MVKKEVLILSFIIVFFFHLLSVYAFAPLEQQRDENNLIEKYRNNFPVIDEGTISLDKGLQTIPHTLVSEVKWGDDGLPKQTILGYFVQYPLPSVLDKDIELRNNEKKLGGQEYTSSELEYYKKKIEQSHEELSNEIMIKLSEHKREKNIKKLKGDHIKKSWKKAFNGIYLTGISKEEIKEIEKIKNIKVFPDYGFHISLTDTIPLINADDVWHLDSDFNNCQEEETCIMGNQITIAIIDTGIDYSHSDFGRCTSEEFLDGRCKKVIGGYDFYSSDPDPMDENGHGTHVASIAAGNGILKGVAPGAQLVSYKIFGDDGDTSGDIIVSALEKAIDPNDDGDFSDHVDIISMSLGGLGTPDDALSQVVDSIVERGSIVVVSAGNSGPEGIPDCRHTNDKTKESVCSPGTARKAITVGASYKKDYDKKFFSSRCFNNPHNPGINDVPCFSSRGPAFGTGFGLIKPDIVAPGVEICAAQWDTAFGIDKGYNNPSRPDLHPCFDNSHMTISGTSMATPVVSGAIALIKQAHPDWSPLEIKMALRNRALDLGLDKNIQGFGRIDILSSMSSSRPLIAEIERVFSEDGIDYIIKGSASGENFDRFIISYKTSDKWVEICSSTEEVVDGVLCTWEMKDLRDGIYLLKLDAISKIFTSSDFFYVEIENTKILTPLNLYGSNWYEKRLYPTWENILIEGTARGYDFEYFTLEFCVPRTFADQPVVLRNGAGDIFFEYTRCIDNVVQIVNDGKSPVSRGLLGVIDPSKIENSGYYSIVLKTHFSKGRTDKEEHIIYLDKDLQRGWPRSFQIISDGSWIVTIDEQPTISDVDKDGREDIVLAYFDKVYIFNHQGEQLKGWPATIIKNPDLLSNKLIAGSVIVDLDRNGRNEIITGAINNHLYAMNDDGTYFFEFKDSLSPSGIAIKDLDGNHEVDIIFTKLLSDSLWVLDSYGNRMPGWPKQLAPYEGFPNSNSIWDAVSIGDIDNDKLDEIIVTSNSFRDDEGGIVGGEGSVTRTWALNYDGSVVNGWPKDFMGEGIITPAALADLDKDGRVDIIAARRNGDIHVWNGKGENLNGWPVETGAEIIGGPSIGDIDLDGQLEVLISAKIDNEDMACIFGYSSYGLLLTGFPICVQRGLLNDDFDPWGYITITNLDTDPEYEILAPPKNLNRIPISFLDKMWAFNHDGSTVEGFPKFVETDSFSNVVPTGDLDGDGDNELIMLTWAGNIYVWDFSGKKSGGEWPMFQHDSWYTGQAGFIIPEPTLKKFIRGDSNDDGGVDISDAVNILNVLFTGQGAIKCTDAADANDDSKVDLTDAVYILSYLFQGGPEPSEPFSDIGEDPTSDNLDCACYGESCE